MPFLDVEHLKKVKGERKRVSFFSDLPPIPVDDRELELLEPAQFELTLTNIGSAISVEGQIAASLQVQCSRCLKNFTLPLEPEFLETYYDKTRYIPGNQEEDWVSYSGGTIDITPEAVGAIMVTLPMRFICSENCRGLCSVCGTDLNNNACECVQEKIDPRMAKLKELME